MKTTKLMIGETFKERYKITKIIGKGGMGTVYLGEDLRLLGKRWAIKEIKLSQNNYQQFLDEAKILVKLKHPYLPRIIDYYPLNVEGYSYLIMEYIEGENLEVTFEKSSKYIPIEKILRYSIQICDLLDYLHNVEPNPIIYRDLKPANIIIDKQDNVSLIDFGIARNYNPMKEVDTIQLGTVGFAAPELFEKKQSDKRSDIYSLGAMIYYLLTQGNYYYLNQKPVSYYRKDISHDFVWVIKQMLSSNPNDRYQNISEVKEELNNVLNSLKSDLTEVINSSNKVKKEKIIEINTNNTNNTNKTIVVANLSKRAGSTFLTLNLASYLSENNIVSSILELPFGPYIFDHIGIDKRLSKRKYKDYSFYSFPHEIYKGNYIKRDMEFIDDNIMWMVADPRNDLITEEQWDNQHMLKLLYSSRRANITFIDVGDHIEHKSIAPILNEVDLILIVVDPMPAEIMMNYESLKRILNYKNDGLPYELVINRFTKGINKKELFDVLKIEPLTYIPAIDIKIIQKSAYECTLPYNHQDVKSTLNYSFNKIVSRIIPNSINNNSIFYKNISWIEKMVLRSKK